MGSGFHFEEVVYVVLESGVLADNIVKKLLVSVQLCFQEADVPEIEVILEAVDIHASAESHLETSKEVVDLVHTSLVPSVDKFA